MVSDVLIETLACSHEAQAAPIMFLGYPNPPDAWNPFCAPENEEHVAKEEFGIWAMSYYKHPAFSGTRTSDVTPASFIQYTPEQQYRPPTSANISTDEMVMIIDPEPNGRSERFFLEMSSSMMHGSLEKAMLGVNVGLLPRLGICYVYGQADVWIVAWAACQFERDLEKWRNSGEHIRPTKVLSVPERTIWYTLHCFIRPYAEVISSCSSTGMIQTCF